MIVCELQPQDIVHRIQPWLLPGDELGRGQRAQGVAIAAAGLYRDFERLAEQAEDDRVLAGIVARANGVIADLVGGPLADLPFAAMAMNRLAHRCRDDLAKLERRATRSV